MLVASLVVDDQSTIRPRGGLLDVEGVYLTPTTADNAARLIEGLAAVERHLKAAEEAATMRLPEDPGPLAAITESELRLLAGDR